MSLCISVVDVQYLIVCTLFKQAISGSGLHAYQGSLGQSCWVSSLAEWLSECTEIKDRYYTQM